MAVDSPSTDDPRLDDDHVRTLDDGRLVLLGVVHDHPASRYRVHELVSRSQPDVLALETPPLALGLFRQYAATDRTIPTLGGELSAAIAAAEDAELVGIDGVDRHFLRTLATTLRADERSVSTLTALVSSIRSVLAHAMGCRLAALIAAWTGLQLAVDRPRSHDCTLRDPPAVQAEDERTQLARSQFFCRLADPPTAVRVRDETREACMAKRLRALEGSVVAVVGYSHLDPLADRLAD